MLIEKLYAETVDIEDPNNYGSSPERYLLTFLRRRFEGRCRKGAFITSITGIVEKSQCRIKTTDLSGEGYVDVRFRAQVYILGQWDIITGIRIVSLASQIVGTNYYDPESADDTPLVAVGGNTVATILPSTESSVIREGQTVSMRVYKVQFGADQPQVTAAGLLLTCDKNAPVYTVEGALTREDAAALAPLAGRIKSLLAARASIAETRYDDIAFFESLVYSYPRAEGAPRAIETKDAAGWRGPAGFPLPAGAGAANILELVGDALVSAVDVTGTWSRDLTLCRSSPLISKAADAKTLPRGWKQPTGATPRTAFGSMLKTVYDFLNAVNEMTAIYDSLEKIHSHKNIWLVMRGAQLPPP